MLCIVEKSADYGNLRTVLCARAGLCGSGSGQYKIGEAGPWDVLALLTVISTSVKAYLADEREL